MVSKAMARSPSIPRSGECAASFVASPRHVIYCVARGCAAEYAVANLHEETWLRPDPDRAGWPPLTARPARPSP